MSYPPLEAALSLPVPHTQKNALGISDVLIYGTLEDGKEM